VNHSSDLYVDPMPNSTLTLSRHIVSDNDRLPAVHTSIRPSARISIVTPTSRNRPKNDRAMMLSEPLISASALAVVVSRRR
jgi:hypothetical protein